MSFAETIEVRKVHSQREGGCIFTAQRTDSTPLRVRYVGKSVQPMPGDEFEARGLLSIYRDKFGRSIEQLETRSLNRVVRTGELLKPWLDTLPNIGPARAQRLLTTFGHDLWAVLSDSSRMTEVATCLEPSKPSLAARIAAQLYAAEVSRSSVQKARAAEAEFLAYLERIGVRQPKVARTLWRLFGGEDAVGRLQRNPYAAACLVAWAVADKVGLQLLREAGAEGDLLSHPTRQLGALNSAYRDALAAGDTALTDESLKTALAARNVDWASAIDVASEKSLLRPFEASDGALLYRIPGAAWLEDSVSMALASMEAQPPTVALPTGEGALQSLVIDAELDAGLTLTDEQRVAVVHLLQLPVAALQGGAGVGKTTVMKVLATAWEYLRGDVVMGALAGKAALTLSRGASTPRRPRLAYTVARLIGMLQCQRAAEEDPSRKRAAGGVTFTSKTLLILDEAGMLDTPNLHTLLTLLPEGARVLFAGDEGQLPPVGIGKVFHDIVAEGSRVARLTRVLRQAGDSDIPKVSAAIRDGVVPVLQPWTGQAEGVFLSPPAGMMTAYRKLRSCGEVMLIAALRNTVNTINSTEAVLWLGPGVHTRRLGPLATVAVGDPVVATANRYADGLFNGLLGVVHSTVGPQIEVLWDGETTPRTLPAEAEGDIELAYAITCHKAQGSSAASVVVAVEDTPLVTREWLYTAITRGRNLVILVGDAEAVAAAAGRRTRRVTSFGLTEQSSSRSCT